MNNNLQKLWIVLIGFLLLVPSAKAQLNVQTMVLPPYSPYLADYIALNNKVTLVVTNPTNQSFQAKIVGTITGNGIVISTPQNFNPQVPITVQPGINNFSGAAINSVLSVQNLSFQGITQQQVLSGNGLPEGNYQLCFRLFNTQNNQPLSPQNGGCFNLNITHFEAPLLLQPTCNFALNEVNPQNHVFSWSVPAGANPINIEYELSLVEVFPANLNPNQALDAATDPIFFRKTVGINSYVYGPADPKLEAEKTYAWRVRAKAKPGKNAAFKNNGKSVACKFVYTAQNQNNQNNNPPDDQSCIADCPIAMPGNQVKGSAQVGDTINLGRFQMRISTLNGNQGTGVISIPFLKAKILVDFSNLEINTDKEAIGSTLATAKIQGNNLLTQAIANNEGGEIALAKNQFDNISNYINQGNKMVSKFVPNMQPVGVPFALDYQGFDLQIVGLIFKPTQAFMNVVFGLEIPEALNNSWVDFAQKGICIRPNGFGIQPKLSLKSDKSLELSADAQLLIKSGGETSVTIGCNGIESVQIKGEYLISREKLLPLVGGKVQPGNAKVRATFTTEITQGLNFTLNAKMEPSQFAIPGAEDLIFSAKNAQLDFSEFSNPQGVVFHTQHPKKNGNNADWKGLYIQTVAVDLPSSFKKGNGAVSLNIQHLMLDKSGLWVNAQANNVITLNNGSVGGWAFSISEVKINIQASALSGGGLKGDIRLPISKTGIGYEAFFEEGINSLEYQIAINTLDSVDAKLWVAKLSLHPGSEISLEKSNSQLIPKAVLNGNMSIGFSQSPDNNTPLSKLAFNGIDFQELTISGGNVPNIDLSFVSLASQPKKQHNLNKFPVNLTALSYEKVGKPGIVFGFDVNLSKGSNGFKAGSTLKFNGKWNAQQKVFEYDGIDVKSISINADIGIMSVDGIIDLYKEDPTFGNGFRGDIDATLKIASVAVKATIQAGKMGDGDPVEENGSNYRYWFVDLSVKWAAGGLPIPGVGALAIYGFGGGAYRNMERNNPAVEVTNAQIVDMQGLGPATVGTSRSGVIYKPKKDKFGFMASVTLGTTGEPTSFNADLKLIAELNTDNFGISKIVFEGTGYVMGPIADRNKRLVKIAVLIESDFEKPMFHAAVTVEGGFNQSALEVTVAASLNLHFEPGMWYIKLGEWANEDYPYLDKKRIQVNAKIDAKVLQIGFNFNAYFMMGTDIGDLPKSPLAVRQMLAASQKVDKPKMNTEKVYLGKGFAFGAGIRFTANLEVFVFYADLELMFGADVLLSKSDAACNGNFDYGLNGWYAKGKAYAYLDVDAGIRLNLWIWKGKFSIVKMKAAAEILAELPNPTYLKGQFALSGSVLNGAIKFSTNYKIEVGQKCVWGSGNPFDDFPIIEELKPENNEKGSVFEAPQASFNFEMGVPFKIVDYSSNKNGKVRWFKTEVKKVELARGFQITPGKYHFNSAKNGITFIPSEILEEKVEYTFKVEAEGFEKQGNKWVKISNEPVRTTKFKTDIKPDHIPDQNLVSALPQIGQRYFLHKDEPKGNVRVGVGQCYLFQKKEDANFTYTYKVKITNLENKQVQYLDIVCSEKNFSYNMPNLANETVFQLEIVRISKPKGGLNVNKNTQYVWKNDKGQPVSEPQNVGNNVPNKMINPNLKLKNNQNQQINKFQNNLNLNSNSNTTMLARRHNEVKQNQITGGQIEKVLLVYHFRTSKYNTAEAKFNTFKNGGHGFMNYFQKGIEFGGHSNFPFTTRVEFPLLEGGELIDQYDAFGYYKENFDLRVDPLVKLSIIWGNNSYFQKLNTNIYDRTYKNEGTSASTKLFAANRYGKNGYVIFGRTDMQFSKRPIEAIKVWNPYTEGPIMWGTLQEPISPKGRLTQSEINKAKNGIKITDGNIKPVIPLNYYLAGIALLDGFIVFDNHYYRCGVSHNQSKNNRKDCRRDNAYPAIDKISASSYSGFGVSNPYTLPKGQTFPFRIIYSYDNPKPYTRDTQFTTK